MAVRVDSEAVLSLLSTHLDERCRYRCLVVQCKEISTLSNFSEQLVVTGGTLGRDVMELEATQFFDDVGALSCDAVLSRVEAVAEQHLLVLTGPLHFLDYWSDDIRARFWLYFATVSNGPGIVIADTFRTDSILGPFQVVEGFSHGVLRCLKSRLEKTQDRLA